MNWSLFWALLLTLGFVIGNILLVKHSAKIKMPSLKELKETKPKPEVSSHKITRQHHDAEKPNSPE